MHSKVSKVALTLEERILNSITLGESHFREFKSAYEGRKGEKRARKTAEICRDIAETLVAFANADGGELLIGVEDDGAITGVPDKEDEINSIMQAYVTHVHKGTPLPKPRIAKVMLEGNTVLYFSVEKGLSYYYITSDGRCVRRSDRDTIPIPVEQIKFDRHEQLSREYDRMYVDGATTADLDITILDKVVSEISPGISQEKCLQYLGLADFSAGNIRLKKAALLLFAKDVLRWHPRCEVRVMKVNGTELKTGKDFNVTLDEIKRGNIFALTTDSWDMIRPHLVETRFSEEGVFKERILYPEDACREALINAIAHRDYSIEGKGIEIRIFDDRMEISNPGALLSTINIEDLKSLKGVHESRNALCSRTLRELGYMREMGEGMRRIFSLVKQNDQISPELESTRESFSITLFNRSIFSDTDQLWIDSYSQFGLEREEKIVLLLGKDRLIAPQQIIDALDIVDTEDYRQLVHKMQLKGILYSGITKHQAYSRAKARRVPVRKIPRYRIRDHVKCKRDLGILLRELLSLGEYENYSKERIYRLKTKLPKENVYNRVWFQLREALKVFGFIDKDNRPTETLSLLIRSQARIPREQRITKAESVVLKVPKAVQEESNELEIPEIEIPQLYVGNLDYETKAEELESLFSRFGKVKLVKIPKDIVSGMSRGFGFVTMESIKEAKKARENLNRSRFKNRTIEVHWSSYAKKKNQWHPI